MNIPEQLLQELIGTRIKKINNSKTLKQIAKEIIKTDNEEVNKELAKKINNP